MEPNNIKLTEHELSLLEYSFFSFNEEIDIWYCQKVHEDFFGERKFDELALRDTLLCICETLESSQCASQSWVSSLQRLYLLSMGLYAGEETGDTEE